MDIRFELLHEVQVLEDKVGSVGGRSRPGRHRHHEGGVVVTFFLGSVKQPKLPVKINSLTSAKNFMNWTRDPKAYFQLTLIFMLCVGDPTCHRLSPSDYC